MDDAVHPEVAGAGASGPVADDPAPKTLSKNAAKKAAKAERYAALKLERRAREKEAKKDKKRKILEKRAMGESGEDMDERNRRKKRPRVHFGGRVVVDLGFDGSMSEKEITSLCSQLAYTYSANRNASYPFTLLYTSLNGRTFTRLESMSDAGYRRWANTEWWHEGYEQLWLDQHQPVTGTSPLAEEGHEVTIPSDSPPSRSHSQHSAQQNVVYLTADSDEELTELKSEETYIIGGICDHNRYKNLCLNKAKESGIRTARLPIGRYLASLPTRKVLTVNQVFEILLKWVETKNWEEALYSVVPKRKFQTGVKGKPHPAEEGDEAGGEGDASCQDEGKDEQAAVEVQGPETGDER